MRTGRHLLLFVPSLFAAACSPTGYYVADIQPVEGGLQVTKCTFDSHGKATTGDCRTETVPIQQAMPSPPPEGPPPEGPARTPRPVPTAAQVKAKLDAKPVHGLIEQCRTVYAKDLTSFAFRITIDPSSGITNVEPQGNVDATFADCAVRAIRAANMPRFDGAPVSYDEVVGL